MLSMSSKSYFDYYWINFGFFATFSTKIFLLTWSFVFIYSIHDLSWARTISKCAVLCSVMALGYAIGSTFFDLYIGKLARLVIYRWAMLSLCLLILAISTKFGIILVLCLMIGFIVGSTFSSITKHLRNRNLKRVENPSPLHMDEISISNLKYQTLSLCFGPLFIILLYDTSYDAKFPALLPALVYAWFFVAVLIYYLKLANKCADNGKYGGFSNEDYPETEDASDSDPLLSNSTNMSKGDGLTSLGLVSTEPIDYPEISIYEGKIPTCFMEFHKDEKKARDAYTNMLRWRAKNQVDNIQERSFPNFKKVLQFYPNFIHGRAKDGCILAYEQIGKANLMGLLNAGSCVEDVVYVLTLRNEMLIKNYSPEKAVDPSNPLSFYYCENRLRFISILDCDGVSMSNLNVSDMIKYIVLSSYVTDQYFPGLVRCILIINTSYSFQYLWSMVVIALPESVKSKIAFPKDLKAGLDEFIEPNQRPSVYGGTDPVELGQSEEHQAFMKLPEMWVDVGVEASHSQRGSGLVDVSAVVPENSTEASDRNGGWFSRVFGHKSAADYRTTSSSGHTKAYLGAENTFTFDKESQTWVCAPAHSELESPSNESLNGNPLSMDSDSDINSSSSSSSSDSDSSYEEDEESRPLRGASKSNGKINACLDRDETDLVMAIEAAHYAKANASTLKSTSPYADRSDRGSFVSANDGIGARKRGAFFSNSANSKNAEKNGNVASINAGGEVHPVEAKRQEVSIQMLFLVCVFQILTSCMYYGLLFIIPAYLLTPFSSGGMNYTLIDLGLTMSTVGFLLYSVSILSLRPKGHIFLKTSPVRGLRIAMVVLISCLILLPVMTQSSAFRSNATIDSNTVMTDDVTDAYMDRHYPTHIIYHSHDRHAHLSLYSILTTTPVYLIPFNILYGILFSAPPSCSVLGLVLPSALIASLVTSGYMGKKASTIITYVTLQSTSFEATTYVLYEFLDAICSTIAPLLMAALYGSTYHLHLSYPWDASFTFFVIILLAVLLYMTTLLIHVQYRGDFGVLIDQSATLQSNAEGFLNSSANGQPSNKFIFNAHAASGVIGGVATIDYLNMVYDTMKTDFNVMKSIYSNNNNSSFHVLGHDKSSSAV